MRCFLAIELPDEVQVRLGELQDAMSSLGRSVRWTPREQIHLTLKFLGEVPDSQVPGLCDVVVEIAADVTPFDLSVCGAGCFPPGGLVRIVWAGIPDAPDELIRCHRACEARYAELGFRKENRRYSPHLTIGRVRDPGASRDIRATVEQQTDFEAGRFTVNELVLYQSVLRPGGPTYTALSRAHLAGGA